jgi:hypothetical protein
MPPAAPRNGGTAAVAVASSSSSSTVFEPPDIRSLSWQGRPGLLYGSVFVWISLTGGRFLAPFLEKEGGLTATEIGLALALQQSVSTLLSSIGGSYADQLEFQSPGRGRAMVLGLGIVVGTLTFTLHGMPRWIPSSSWWLGEKEEEQQEQERHSWSVSWHIVLRCIYAMSTSSVFPVLDGMTIQYLHDTAQSQSDYGKERLVGAITWAITNLCLAPLLDWIGFSVIYPLALLSALSVVWTIWIHLQWQQLQLQQPQVRRFPKRTSDIIDQNDKEEKEDENNDSGAMWLTEQPQDHFVVDSNDYSTATTTSDVYLNHEVSFADNTAQPPRIPICTLLRMLLTTTSSDGGSGSGSSMVGVAFLLALLCLSSGQAVVDSLIFLFFEVLESSYSLMGFTVLLTVAFEIPIFQVAPQLLERFGPIGLLLLAGLGYIVRVLGYTCIPAGHMAYVLFLEPLHGVTYACSQMAAVDFVARRMPFGYEASGQGLVYLFRGMGSVLGLALGGWAEDHWGPRSMYRSSALFVTCGCLVLLAVVAVPRGGLSSISSRERHQQQQQGHQEFKAQHHILPETSYGEHDDTDTGNDVEFTVRK